MAQKIVSKAEGRLVNLSQIEPSNRAIELAKKVGKDPRFIEVVLRESSEVLRTRPGTIIVEHKRGFICANAGIDHSNVAGSGAIQKIGCCFFLKMRIRPRRAYGYVWKHSLTAGLAF